MFEGISLNPGDLFILQDDDTLDSSEVYKVKQPFNTMSLQGLRIEPNEGCIRSILTHLAARDIIEHVNIKRITCYRMNDTLQIVDQ